MSDTSREVGLSETTEAERTLAEIRSLRRTLCDAWQGRAVTFSREERRELRNEIRYTCTLLMELTETI